MPIRYVINFQKAGTLPFIYFLMTYYNNYSNGCYLYLALHGSYGIVWILKDLTFPDASFQRKASIIPLGSLAVVLMAYWYLPMMMANGYGVQ